jgi:predicted DNA-binding transcriptional regulator AlpA
VLSLEERHRRDRQRVAALNERDAARYIGMSESWLRHNRLYEAVEVPRHIKIGRSIRYRVSDLDAFLEERASSARQSA